MLRKYGPVILVLLIPAIVLAGVAARDRLAPVAQGPVQALVKVDSHVPRILFETAEVQADPARFRNTQVALITSRMILDDVLRTPEISRLATVQRVSDGGDDPAEWLEEHLEVGYLKDADILRIALRGGADRADQAKILNRVVDLYLEKVVQADQRDRQTRLEDLRKLWTRYQDELKTKRKSLQELEASAATDSPLRLAPAQVERLLELTVADLARVQSELRAARAEKAVREHRPAAEALAPPANPTALDAQIALLEEQERLTRAQIVDDAKPADPRRSLGLEVEWAEIGLAEETARRIGREVEALEVELNAPTRVEVIDRAKP